MPVARWPRTMASMLLMGEVSPLYCAQTLNGSGQGRPRKRTARKGAATERVRSAMEARVQLSLAEKDFVKLAAQVLDQYDMLLIERQKLARTRPIKQVGDPYWGCVLHCYVPPPLSVSVTTTKTRMPPDHFSIVQAISLSLLIKEMLFMYHCKWNLCK